MLEEEEEEEETLLPYKGPTRSVDNFEANRTSPEMELQGKLSPEIGGWFPEVSFPRGQSVCPPQHKVTAHRFSRIFLINPSASPSLSMPIPSARKSLVVAQRVRNIRGFGRGLRVGGDGGLASHLGRIP